MKKQRIFKYGKAYKGKGKKRNMEWIYGLGALIFGGSSIWLYVQQYFFFAIVSFLLGVMLAYTLEKN